MTSMRLLPSLLALGLMVPAHAGSLSSELAARVQAALAIVPASMPGAVVPEPPQAVKPATDSQELEDRIAALIDELMTKDPALFNRIRAEDARIRALLPFNLTPAQPAHRPAAAEALVLAKGARGSHTAHHGVFQRLGKPVRGSGRSRRHGARERRRRIAVRARSRAGV